jgi:serine/threonine-protein kinase mTOR
LKVWIDVIPQLLARIDIKDETIRKTLIELVEKISLKFPQAILYSLSVQEISTSNERKRAAKQLFEKLKTTQKTLIDQATTISTEMNRSAIVRRAFTFRSRTGRPCLRTCSRSTPKWTTNRTR